MPPCSWIAWRVIKEILRDRRTVAFFILVPIVVMTLIYYAISEEEVARLGVLTRGAGRMFEYDLIKAIEEEKELEIVTLGIGDEVTDRKELDRQIRALLLRGEADGVLYFGEDFFVERFGGKSGTLTIYLEGSRPTLNATVLSTIGSAMDELASKLPVVIDSSCSSFCANSVNINPIHLEKTYLYGSDDLRLIDFFLPVFPPFFVFFFTFIISTVTFQRERVRGTLERILIAPVSFFQLVMGYVMGFFIFSTVQVVIILAFLLALIGYPLSGWQVLNLGVISLMMMLIALLLGLLVSFLAHNEFQAIQFIPLMVLPQVFLSDMIWDIKSFPEVFQWISVVLPLTHANGAMRNVLLKNMTMVESWQEVIGLGVFLPVIMVLLLYVGTRPGRGA